MEEKQTLKDFLHIDEIKDFGKLSPLHLYPTISRYYLFEYGFMEGRELHCIKYDLDAFALNSFLEKEVFENEDIIKERINESQENELIELYNVLISRIKKENKKIYYEGLISAYHCMKEDCLRLSKKSWIYNQKVKPVLINSERNIASSYELKRILTKDDFKVLFPFQFDKGKNIEVTLQDIQTIEEKLQNKDKCRNDFHKIILGYAQKEMGRDHLDVVLDILSKDVLISADSLIDIDIKPHLSKNRTSLVLNFGVKEVQAAFGIEYTLYEKDGKEMVHTISSERSLEEVPYIKEEIKKGYKILKEARKLDSWEKPKYKSYIKGNGERKDNGIIKKAKIRFPDYILSAGDELCSHFHGKIKFLKRLEIDVAKIKKEKINPDGKIHEIIEYVRDLINNKPTTS